MNQVTKFLKWLKTEIAKDQHPVSKPLPVKGEPRWVTTTHKMQEYDFRMGKRNDGSEE